VRRPKTYRKWLLATPLRRHYSNPQIRQAIEDLHRHLP
jgi:hypothetical protein